MDLFERLLRIFRELGARLTPKVILTDFEQACIQVKSIS